MADRLLRDELLDSERYLALESDTAQKLFVHFLLVADDLGNAEAGHAFIRRRLLRGRETNAEIDGLLITLAENDLIRPYLVDGRRLIHIPRFRQRLRYPRGKVPQPPPEITKENNGDRRKKTDQRQTKDKPKAGHSQARAVRSEVKRSEVNLNRARTAKPVDNSNAPTQTATSKPVETSKPATPTATPPAPARAPQASTGQRANGHAEPRTFAAILASEWRSSQAGIASMAAALELRPTAGETWESLGQRCELEIARRQTAKAGE